MKRNAKEGHIDAVPHRIVQILTHNCRIIRNLSAIQRKMSTFASANSRRADFARGGSGSMEGVLHFEMRC